MANTTRATDFLKQAGVAFTLRDYDYDPAADEIGMQAAQALGVAPDRVLKTLMARVDGKPVCAILRSDRKLSLKRLAAAIGGKSAEMMSVADAEKITGYVVGGISPFAQKRTTLTLLDADALTHDQVFINAGKRGLQLCLSPHDAVRALAAKPVPLAMDG